MSPISADEVQKIITQDATAELLVKQADQFGRELKDLGLSTSQIRSLFGEVRQIQGEWAVARQKGSNATAERQKVLRRLILLKPKMEYRARRERGQAVRALVDVLKPALDAVTKAPVDKQDEYFNRFVEFFEAILAYHKAYGGN
ncbi:MAG: type III-A CRISPR-associated protein Csm2 [Chloroflexota bacterium]